MEEFETGERSHIPGEKLFSFFTPISKDSASTLYENFGVGQKDKTIVKIGKVNVTGGDLKTMEYSVENNSYSVASPGQINDVVFLAYLELLKESAREADIELVTYDTHTKKHTHTNRKKERNAEKNWTDSKPLRCRTVPFISNNFIPVIQRVATFIVDMTAVQSNTNKKYIISLPAVSRLCFLYRLQ